MTPLKMACAHDRADVVRLLVSRGADVHGSGTGETPLSVCCMCNQAKAARVLLERGAGGALVYTAANGVQARRSRRGAAVHRARRGDSGTPRTT